MKIKIFSVLRGTFMVHGDVIVLSTGISQTFGFTNWDFFKEFKVRLWAWRAILLFSISSSLWHEAIKSDATPPMNELLVHPRVVTPSAFCRFLGQFVGNHYCSWLKLVVWQKSFLHKNKTQWPAQPCPILILSIRSLLHWPWGHNGSLSFPELIKMYLLSIISIQYPALMSWEYSKLSLKEIVFVFLI